MDVPITSDSPGDVDFSVWCDLVDLDEAITAHQHAVRLTLDSHTDRPRRLNNIGNSFLWRFARLGDFADLDEAIMAQ